MVFDNYQEVIDGRVPSSVSNRRSWYENYREWWMISFENSIVLEKFQVWSSGGWNQAMRPYNIYCFASNDDFQNDIDLIYHEGSTEATKLGDIGTSGEGYINNYSG